MSDTDSAISIPRSVFYFAAEWAGKLMSLPEDQQRQLHRFVTMLRNGSPLAIQAAQMFGRGEISWLRLLEMMD
jgi:hypothetical protein